MFFNRVSKGRSPTQEDENGFRETSLAWKRSKRLLCHHLSTGSATLPFVISTGAQRSGEISVLMLIHGNVFESA